MSDTLAARRAARTRFFAAKAAAARAATAARPHGPVPVEPFEVQIGLIQGSSTETMIDGTIRISDAMIVDAASGREIDGARIVVRGVVARQLAADPQMHGAPIEGTAIATDDGYELVSYDGSISLKIAA